MGKYAAGMIARHDFLMFWFGETVNRGLPNSSPFSLSLGVGIKRFPSNGLGIPCGALP